MSKSTKRKHVVKELLTNDYQFPTETQQIVKLLEGRGNNLHSVAAEDGTEFLVSMPSKFRKNVWVKRGDFLLIDLIPEGDKVKGEISSILDAGYIKYLKSNFFWPKPFEEDRSSSPGSPNNYPAFTDETDSSSDSD